jgi:hypothetical protein
MLSPSFEKLESRPGGERFSLALEDQGDTEFPSFEASFSKTTDEV